jgi:hypothetical protein
VRAPPFAVGAGAGELALLDVVNGFGGLSAAIERASGCGGGGGFGAASGAARGTAGAAAWAWSEGGAAGAGERTFVTAWKSGASTSVRVGVPLSSSGKSSRVSKSRVSWAGSRSSSSVAGSGERGRFWMDVGSGWIGGAAVVVGARSGDAGSAEGGNGDGGVGGNGDGLGNGEGAGGGVPPSVGADGRDAWVEGGAGESGATKGPGAGGTGARGVGNGTGGTPVFAKPDFGALGGAIPG